MESFILILEIEKSHVCNYQIIPYTFASGQYCIENSIGEKIERWSEYLYIEKNEYSGKRSNDLQLYYKKRKAKRNFEWYLRRLNLESVRMILGARLNKKKYNNIMREYIS